MSEKLISAEKLISTGVVLGKIEKEIREIPFIADPYAVIRTDYDIGYNNALAMAKAIVMNTPAVDAVEVVRCFGCKHSDTKQTFEVSNNRIVREYPTVRYCERFNTEVNNSFFCGYGEWRTKNANDTGKSD